MSRLPIPGQDDGTWGDILNDYLTQSHNPDGSLKASSLSAAGSYSKPSGGITASDLSSSVNAQLAAAQNAVQSVNGKTGSSISLTASDVSAISQTTADGRYIHQDGTGLPSSVVNGSSTTSAGTPLMGSTGSFIMRDITSPLDEPYSAVADFNMTGATITISGSSLNQGTMSAVPSDLASGKTMIIAGLTAAVVVQSISGSVVTFTGSASGAVSGAIFAWGTDNTTALNSWLQSLGSTNKKLAVWPAGKYLITGTIGQPDDGTVRQVIPILTGGAAINGARQARIPTTGGTHLVWGGAAGGTMMAWRKMSFIRVIGGLSLNGQPCSDSYGPFTFGNRAGIGLLHAQPGNAGPSSYQFIDDLACCDLDVPVQFAEGQTDNNCDTTTIERLICWRTTALMIMSGAQQTTYRIGHLESLANSRGVVLAGGGTITIDLVHLSQAVGAASRTDSSATAGSGASVINDPAILASDYGRPVSGTGIPAGCTIGTITPGVSFGLLGGTTSGAVSGVTLGQGYAGIESNSGVNGASCKVGLMRLEQGCAQVNYVAHYGQLNIDSFEECLTAASNLNLFFVDGETGPGGRLRIGQMSMFSFNPTQGPTTSPIYIQGASSKTGQVIIDSAMWSGAGGGVNLTSIFGANANAWVDVTVRKLRDNNGNTLNPINTRLQSGRTLLYGSTTDATTGVTLTQVGLPTSIVFGATPQVPRGYFIINVWVVGDRGDGTYAVFQRQVRGHREGAVPGATITIDSAVAPSDWMDVVPGTEQVSSLTVNSNGALLIQVKGTASKTISWQATAEMAGWTAATAAL